METVSAPGSRVSKNRNMTRSTKIYQQGLVYISETKVHQDHLSRGKIVKYVLKNAENCLHVSSCDILRKSCGKIPVSATLHSENISTVYVRGIVEGLDGGLANQ